MRREGPERDDYEGGFRDYRSLSPDAGRALYFGNLPDGCPPRKVLDLVYGGPLESCHFVTGKNCCFVTFLSAGAAEEYFRRMSEGPPPKIDNKPIKIGWGRSDPLSPQLEDDLRAGATRTIFLGDAEEEYQGDSLEKFFNSFGVLDKIDYVPAKKIAFVHFCRVTSAIKAMRSLNSNPEFSNKRINFAADRCATPTPQRRAIADKPEIPAFAKTPPGVTGPEDIASPVLWIGNLEGKVDLEVLRNRVSQLGTVREVKLTGTNTHKNVSALVTYSTPAEAATAAAQLQGEVLEGQTLQTVATKVSKNLWIGNLEGVTDQKLKECFMAYGEVHSVKVLPTKCAFVNFVKEVDALNAFQALNLTSLGTIGEDMSISFQYAKPKAERSKKAEGGRQPPPPPPPRGEEWARKEAGGPRDFARGPREPISKRPRGVREHEYAVAPIGRRPYDPYGDLLRPPPPPPDAYRAPPDVVASYGSLSPRGPLPSDYARARAPEPVRANGPPPPRGFQAEYHDFAAAPKRNDAVLLGEAVRSCAICRVSILTVDDFYQHYLGAAHTLEADELMSSGYTGEALDEHRVVLAALRGPKAELQAYLRAELQPAAAVPARSVYEAYPPATPASRPSFFQRDAVAAPASSLYARF